MKRLINVAAAAVLLSLNVLHAEDCTCSGMYDEWHSAKFSMFIHFGLYSYYGGVWNGQPVTRGYSEQIQSHAGIYGDWYARAAEVFDPVMFDADEIASLAVESGMKSIVFTSKHHDGFCMFDTETTGYDSVDMMPSGRDFVAELSEACRRHGLKFGLYFSLIDWNYPYAYPISSHNADFITDRHHELNMSQVRELLTSYGPVSELWFDMGSLTPVQSSELYSLVKSLQPDCMVSGRLGNDMYDFAVMPDNTYPDGTLQAPWQTAASMFDETWSWRSWQERGRPSDKVSEKLRSLVEVVSHGGNFLLNVGPDSTGAVIPFEREVLAGMGRWLKQNGDAIYGTEPSPFREDFEWGTVTVKDNRMNLILSGAPPADGRIVIPSCGIRSVRAMTPDVMCRLRNGEIEIRLPSGCFGDPADFKVIRLETDRNLEDMDQSYELSDERYLVSADAQKDHSYSCFDYYSNYRSTVAYGWNFMANAGTVSLVYPEEDAGRKVGLDINGTYVVQTLSEGEAASLPMASVEMGRMCHAKIRGGTFIGPSEWKIYDSKAMDSMDMVYGGCVSFSDRPFSNHILSADVDVAEEGFAVLEVSAGNGMELVLDGNTVVKHLNPYGTARREEKVVLYLKEGPHQIVLRSYNRFEKESHMGLKLSDTVFRSISVPVERRKACALRLSAADRISAHTDSGLHNVIIINGNI